MSIESLFFYQPSSAPDVPIFPSSPSGCALPVTTRSVGASPDLEPDSVELGPVRVVQREQPSARLRAP